VNQLITLARSPARRLTPRSSGVLSADYGPGNQLFFVHRTICAHG
jgi:hypothetical protein